MNTYRSIGWISVGLGLVAILVHHLISIFWLVTLLIAVAGLCVGIYGISKPEERATSIAGIAVCAIAIITHFNPFILLLLIGVAAYFFYIRRPKRKEPMREIDSGGDGDF
ncbi:MAG TPA: hypothetical protein PKV16_06785 [Caldisericia bacterium]|nr:hypothetical protein [Caldisericia bacterium]HPF49472.1 hypothetical protein [Caldisericia bacterium]HPI84234.1 hypothetical protein [Caldisericia bacterium]HPQ93471.1 hypothetical protein [Caldisericia bacterium]HRV75523.1 hypothetical protein [Caldisericia bacterium]